MGAGMSEQIETQLCAKHSQPICRECLETATKDYSMHTTKYEEALEAYSVLTDLFVVSTNEVAELKNKRHEAKVLIEYFKGDIEKENPMFYHLIPKWKQCSEWLDNYE